LFLFCYFIRIAMLDMFVLPSFERVRAFTCLLPTKFEFWSIILFVFFYLDVK
jgi:hypothetical protein